MQKPVFGTFGIFRLLLSCGVVLAHVNSSSYYYIGMHAVFVFYLLSGYVVTYAFVEQYSALTSGLSKFYINRLIRIYPLYWVALIFSVVMLSYYPQLGLKMDSRLYYVYPFDSPGALANWFHNLTLTNTVGISGDLLNPALVPPSWSVGCELVYWFMLPALIYFRRLRLCVLVFAVLWTLSFLIIQPDGGAWFKTWYRSPLSGLLPFMLGVYMFYARQHMAIKKPYLSGVAIIAIYYAYLMYGPFSGVGMQLEGFYLSLLPGVLMVYYLSCIDSKKLPRRLVAVDKLLGNMAYGVLLFHQQVASLLYLYTPGITLSEMLSGTLLLTMLISVITDLLVEKPFEHLRRRFKH